MYTIITILLIILVSSITLGLLLKDLKTVLITVWGGFLFVIVVVNLIEYAEILDQRFSKSQIERLPKEFTITDSNKKIQVHWVHDSLFINNFK